MDRTSTYIVGAGLSAASDFRLLTMRGFFSKLDGHLALSSFLHWFYPGRAPDEYNLEEVMSYLHLSRARTSIWTGTWRNRYNHDSANLYDELLAYVKERLTVPPKAECRVHERLVRELKPKDTIISFNYDLLIDSALLQLEPKRNDRPHENSRMGKLSGLLGRMYIWNEPPPSLLPREQEWGYYLKLHGSLDWLYCLTPGCPNNTNMFALGVDPLAEGQSEGLPCRCCGSTIHTFIVPPVATKRLEDTGRMAFLWNLALRELSAADRIVVVGISFAPNDFELRWLVRQAISSRQCPRYELHIVNSSESDAEMIDGVFPGAEKNTRVFRSIDAFCSGS